MTALTFTLKKELSHSLDCSRLTAAVLADKSIAEIKAMTLEAHHTVADWFTVSGSDASHIVFKDTNQHLSYIGKQMQNGTITIEGDCGDFLGQSMKGGTIICKGNAGDRAGDKMRRGILLIEGNAGDYRASSLMAGTLGVLGASGSHLGYSMKRGTLLLAKSPTEQITWVDCGIHTLPFLKLLFKSFANFDTQFAKLTSTRAQRWMGDISGIGKAEILLLNQD